MTTVLKHLEAAIKSTAKANAKTLNFISDFKDSEGKDLRNRWELWLQIELMRQLDIIKPDAQDLYSEYREDYKAKKNKGAGRTKKGFVSGCLDIAFRPQGGDKGWLVGLELKVKRTASAAIRGGLHDLLKPHAFKSGEWRFRAIYAMCVFDSAISEDSDSKYLKFAKKNKWVTIPLGKKFTAVLIGWETKPRSGDYKMFYKEYGGWVKDVLKQAEIAGLTINIKPSEKSRTIAIE